MSGIARLGIQEPLERARGIGAAEGEAQELRLPRIMLAMLMAVVGILAIGWGGVYAVFDEPLAASLPLAYAGLSAILMVVMWRTGAIARVLQAQLVLIVFVPFVLAVTLGGFIASSGVVLWSLLGPISAFLIGGRRGALPWLSIYLLLVVLLAALHPWLPSGNNLPTAAVLSFFALNIGAVSTIAFGMIFYFVGENRRVHALLVVEKEKSERLLLNVLPRDIADILREEDRTIAEQFDATSILFADVVGFTPLSAIMEPRETVELLNAVFTHFDSLTLTYDLEKVRTMGDSYMVVAGAPRRRDDHAQALARMAIDMRDWLETHATYEGGQLRFRIGMSSGSLVGGVIGTTKFHYDVWGDAVNLASRMESHGEPGRIQIAAPTYELLKNDFRCSPRGTIEIKGKGMLETWFLEDALPASERRAPTRPPSDGSA